MCKPESISSLAPEMRSAETKKTSKSCHGLLVQLNWKLIGMSKPSQALGNALPLLYVVFLLLQAYTNCILVGKNCYSLYNLYFLERQFSYFGLFLSLWKPGSEKAQGSPDIQACRADTVISIKYLFNINEKQDIPTKKQQK